MEWQIEGADKETGEDIAFILDTPDEITSANVVERSFLANWMYPSSVKAAKNCMWPEFSILEKDPQDQHLGDDFLKIMSTVIKAKSESDAIWFYRKTHPGRDEKKVLRCVELGQNDIVLPKKMVMAMVSMGGVDALKNMTKTFRFDRHLCCPKCESGHLGFHNLSCTCGNRVTQDEFDKIEVFAAKHKMALYKSAKIVGKDSQDLYGREYTRFFRQIRNDIIPPEGPCSSCGEDAWVPEGIASNRASAKWRCGFCNSRVLIRADTQESATSSSGERQPIPKEIQREVWQRDQGKCVECGTRADLQFDHIIAFSLGGANTVRNLQLLCGPCNRRKSNKTPGSH